MRPLPHLFRLVALALVLGLTALVLPAGAQETTTTSSPTSTTTTSTTAAGDAQAEDSYTEAVDITFPASPSVKFTDDYHQPRSGGRVHRATDLMGPKGTMLYAARAGTVCFMTGYDKVPPSYGVMLTICGDDGRKYDYIHINNDTPGTDDAQGGPEFAFSPGLHRGGTVERGQWIATMGDSGNAESTAPHLHFEIEDPTIVDPYGTNQRNPYKSLTAALERDDVPTEPGPPGLDPVVRVGGIDRVATAIALAARWQRAPAVVLASGDRVPDSLAAGPLAATAEGPVLLNLGSRLDPRVAAELKRLRPTWVVLVGGPSALSNQTDADVRSAVPDSRVDRIFGADRFATAAAVSRTVWASSSKPRSAVIALGDHSDPARAWPDALTAGWLGALTHRPVLLTAPNSAPKATLDALEGVASAVVVGGEAPVPTGVFSRLDQVVGTLTRLAGADRYATAIQVAEAGVRAGATLTHLRVVTGRGPGDALAAGAAAADEKAVMVLVDGLEQRADPAMSYYLRPRSAQIHTAAAIGGPEVMTDAAIARLRLRIT